MRKFSCDENLGKKIDKLSDIHATSNYQEKRQNAISAFKIYEKCRKTSLSHPKPI
jgi:hypothetical protein